MIENLVVFTLGALVATLLALLVIPVIWRRAARLIEQRIRATTPLTMMEIQSEKDLIRAGFAVQLRKLEVKFEEVKRLAAQRQIEIGRRVAETRELETELAAREQTIDDLEVREEELQGTVLALERQITLQATALKEKQQAISAANDALLARGSELTETSGLADTRKVEVAALSTQLENFKNRVEELRAELATRSIESESNASEVDELKGILKGRDSNIAMLNKRIARRRELSLERRRRAQELDALLAAQRERVAEKTAALSAAELKRMKYEDDIKKAAEERAELKGRIADLEAKLELKDREVARLKKSGAKGGSTRGAKSKRDATSGDAPSDADAGGEGDADKLRESITDLAARITRLAAEDGDSEISALIDAVSVDSRSRNGAVAKVGGTSGGDRRVPLAERIKEVDLTPGE